MCCLVFLIVCSRQTPKWCFMASMRSAFFVAAVVIFSLRITVFKLATVKLVSCKIKMIKFKTKQKNTLYGYDLRFTFIYHKLWNIDIKYFILSFAYPRTNKEWLDFWKSTNQINQHHYFATGRIYWNIENRNKPCLLEPMTWHQYYQDLF